MCIECSDPINGVREEQVAVSVLTEEARSTWIKCIEATYAHAFEESLGFRIT